MTEAQLVAIANKWRYQTKWATEPLSKTRFSNRPGCRRRVFKNQSALRVLNNEVDEAKCTLIPTIGVRRSSFLFAISDE